MIIPEGLWLPTLKDSVAQFAPQRVSRRVDFASAAASVTATGYTVPADFVLFLSAVTGTGVGGGGQLTNTVTINVTDQGAAVRTALARVRFSDYGLGAAVAQLDAMWSGLAVVMPGEAVEVNGEYSAAAAANTTTVNLNGVLIPRGNWQFG